MHRPKKTNQTAERTIEIMELSREAVINQHTNQVVKGLQDITINLYVG